ncbi:hypothetical protein [Pontiella sp.]|uniref:hypothetical protein n=1 Tax=Pontiella sp. TaxID=2837462 RepID=UPI003568FD04
MKFDWWRLIWRGGVTAVAMWCIAGLCGCGGGDSGEEQPSGPWNLAGTWEITIYRNGEPLEAETVEFPAEADGIKSGSFSIGMQVLDDWEIVQVSISGSEFRLFYSYPNEFTGGIMTMTLEGTIKSDRYIDGETHNGSPGSEIEMTNPFTMRKIN